MSNFAVFSLKYPSLLLFQENLKDPVRAHNLQTLYGISNVPSDTYMRERLDELDPELIKPAFKRIFAQAQRGKDLEKYQHLEQSYLISIDGTGHFSSNKVYFENCCVKNSTSGQKYYHQMLSAVLVHPRISLSSR